MSEDVRKATYHRWTQAVDEAARLATHAIGLSYQASISAAIANALNDLPRDATAHEISSTTWMAKAQAEDAAHKVLVSSSMKATDLANEIAVEWAALEDLP